MNDGKKSAPIKEVIILLVDKGLKPVYMVASTAPFDLSRYPDMVRVIQGYRSFFLRKDSPFLPWLQSNHQLTNEEMGQMAGVLTPMDYSCSDEGKRAQLELHVEWRFEDIFLFDEIVDVSKLDYTLAVKKQFSFGKGFTVQVIIYPHGKEDDGRAFFNTASGKKIYISDEAEDSPHGCDTTKPLVFSANPSSSPWASAILLYQKIVSL